MQANLIEVNGGSAVVTKMVIFADSAGYYGKFQSTDKGVQPFIELAAELNILQLLKSIPVPTDVCRV